MPNLTFINDMLVGGDVQGTYGNTFIPDETVTAKKLTGLTVSEGGDLSEEDSILSAISKLAANIINGGGGGSGTGTPGADGKTIRNGIGIPSNSLGVDGDFYINKSNWTIYGPKTSGAWGSATSIVGPTGATGSTGPTGATGAAGQSGLNGTNGKTILNGFGTPSSGQGVDGDFYINKSDYTIFGPKTSGAWGSATSLIGPQGPAGSGGSGGTTIASGITVTAIGNISSTNAQAAFQELQSDIDTINSTLPNKADSSSVNSALALKAPLASPTFTGTVTGSFSGNLAGNASTATTATNLTGNITESQVTGLTADLAAKAPLASPTFTGTVTAPTFSGALSGNATTATSATTAGTATTITGTITESQVTNLTTDLAAKAPLASPTFTGVVTAPTFSGALSGNATTATTATNLSGNITESQVTGLTADLAAKAPLASPTFTGTVTAPTFSGALSGNATTATNATTAANLTGNITQSQVTGLSTALAAKAPLASPTFTGTVTGSFSGPLAGNADTATTATNLSGNITESQVTGLIADLASKASTASLTTAVSSLEAEIDTKANADATTAALATKATSAALDALAAIVGNKADLAAMLTALAGKMDMLDLTGMAGKFLSNNGTALSWLTPGLTLNRVETGAQDYHYDTNNPAPNIIEISNLSVSRNVYLPKTDTVPDGWSLDVVDLTGQCSPQKKITIVPGSITDEYIASGNAYSLFSGNSSISMYNNAPARKWMIRSSFGSGNFTIAPFIPTSGLVAHFDPAAPGGVTLGYVPQHNRMGIAELNDLRGSGYKFVKDPLRNETSYPYDLNGFNPDSNGNLTTKGVVFDGGGGQKLVSNMPFSALSHNTYTIVMVVEKHTQRGFGYLNDDTNNLSLISSKFTRMALSNTQFSPYGFPRRPVTYAIQNNNGVLSYFLNGTKYPAFISPSVTGMGYTDTNPWGNISLGEDFVNWTLGTLLLYNRALTDSEHQSIAAQFANTHGIQYRTKRINLVVDGNSISEGAAAGGLTTSDNSLLLKLPYMEHAMTALGYDSDEWINMSHSGYTTGMDITRAPTAVDPLYDSSFPANKNILCFCEGSNAIANGNSSYTAEVAYNEIKTYCQARKAAGWKVVVGTTLPRLFNGNVENPNFNPVRLQVNSWIVANAVSEGWADAVADQASDVWNDPSKEFGVDGVGAAPIRWHGYAEPLATYYADGCHPNELGHARMAPYWRDAIQSILNS